MRRRGNGEGGIYYYRNDGRWSAGDKNYDDHREKVYGTTRTDVAAKLAMGLRARDRVAIAARAKGPLGGFRPNVARAADSIEEDPALHVRNGPRATDPRAATCVVFARRGPVERPQVGLDEAPMLLVCGWPELGLAGGDW
jgi:hypothetical protein